MKENKNKNFAKQNVEYIKDNLINYTLFEVKILKKVCDKKL